MIYKDWVFHDIEPVYLQLVQKIEYAILSNQLSAGEDIPSVREMAMLLHISPNTVMKAYKLVGNSGLIISSRNGHYSVLTDEEYIFQKREETAKELCCSYLRNMLSMGFSKKEATDFFVKYSNTLKEPNI